MAKPRHKLSNINPIARTAICAICGPTTVRSACKANRPLRGFRCNTKDRKQRTSRKRKHAKFKQVICAQCGFIPMDKCQMDVHHIDGDHHNNNPANLTTLCANCHRLVHFAPK